MVFAPAKEIETYFDKFSSQICFNKKHLTGSGAKANQTPKTRKSARQATTKDTTQKNRVAKTKKDDETTKSKLQKVPNAKSKFSPSDHAKKQISRHLCQAFHPFLCRSLWKNNVSASFSKRLFTLCRLCFQDVCKNHLQKLFESVTKRISNVISLEGALTKY